MNHVRLLILDTSTRRALIALAEGATVLSTAVLEESRRHARDLAPRIGELLRHQGWKARDLQGVIVSRGPGSYTGLRVGLISAKTLSYATGCPLVALETFPVLAEQAPKEVAQVDIISDAQQNKIYLQSFAYGNAGWQAVSCLQIVSVAEWLEKRAETAWISGPGIVAKQRLLPAGLPLVAEALREPQAQTLLQLGRTRLARGESDDVFAVEPIYLRPSAAEEQWDARAVQK